MTEQLPEYELYAIRYAHRAARRSDHFTFGDPHDGPLDMDYYVWVAVHPQRSVLVDLGFSEETASKRKRDFLRCPVESVRLVGVDPDQISDVVITHLHYDHAGNFKKLPKAKFHIQEPEIHFATGHHIRQKFFSPGYEVEDIVDVVRANFDRRVMFYNGRVDLAPGISLEPMPGHTPGQQVVRVHTRRGWVTLLSDASHYYENIRDCRPYPAATNLPELVDSFEKILAMSGGLDYVIPGHDPLIRDVYPPRSPDLKDAVIRLDVPPDQAKFQAYWEQLKR